MMRMTLTLILAAATALAVSTAVAQDVDTKLPPPVRARIESGALVGESSAFTPSINTRPSCAS